jgi:hypothetical protein
MKTDELIEMLARGAGPAPRALPLRRLTPALAGGLLLGVAGAVGLFGPIPAALYADPGPWIKFAYAGLLATVAVWWVARLGRPAAPVAAPARLAGAVVALMLMLGMAALLAAPPGERLSALLGHSWVSCPLSVLALSLPTLAGALWALRGLAPTHLRRAGFAAGVLAGAVGAFSYALSCSELSPSFVAVWYTAGIGLAGLLGAWLGPRWLRW